MAGLRMSVVVCATAFLLGMLFTHWIADSLTLWKTPALQTDERLWTAAAYYAVLSRMPPALAYVFGAVALVGGATILWSLRDGRAGNLMFDGGSILLYGTALYVYMTSVVPSILTHYPALPLPLRDPALPADLPPFPAELKAPTYAIASSHLVCSVVLTGVMTLQAGRWWAEQADVDDEEDEGGEDRDGEDLRSRQTSPQPETKKTK